MSVPSKAKAIKLDNRSLTNKGSRQLGTKLRRLGGNKEHEIILMEFISHNVKV